VSDDLTVMEAEFPAYDIWREELPGRTMYVARTRRWDLNPYSVATQDLGELCDVLEPTRGIRAEGPVSLTSARPNIARMYDYWLTGTDPRPPDRAAADDVLARFPEVAEVARANRAFLSRAVRYVAERGITQFIDAGSGLPTSPNVHEAARSVTPAARVVYADRDPAVVAHTRAILAEEDNVRVVAGDIRVPGSVLNDPALNELIDRSKPVCVLLMSVLHFLPAAEADAAVARFRRWMKSGSYLIISAGTSSGTDPELITTLQNAYRGTAPVSGRTGAEIAAWFEGFDLVPPGLVNVWAWRPDSLWRPTTSRARFLGGVGRKASDARPPPS
jgi:O-methyltransferase involved in polyketide biosynthesis